MIQLNQQAYVSFWHVNNINHVIADWKPVLNLVERGQSSSLDTILKPHQFWSKTRLVILRKSCDDTNHIKNQRRIFLSVFFNL